MLVIVPSALCHFRQAAKQPVQELVLGEGSSLAVCPSLRMLVTTVSYFDRLVLFDIAPGGHFTPRSVVGGRGTGPLQFHLSGDSTILTMGPMCFTLGATPTPLIPEAGNDRVQEIDPVTLTPVGMLLEGVLECPCGVAASQSRIAVAGWSNKGFHGVILLDAITRVTVRIIDGDKGPGWGLVDAPIGLRLSTDGKLLVVAEFGNNHVSVLDVSTSKWMGCLGDRELPSLFTMVTGWLECCDCKWCQCGEWHHHQHQHAKKH
jgi:hypothetical protein